MIIINIILALLSKQQIKWLSFNIIIICNELVVIIITIINGYW